MTIALAQTFADVAGVLAFGALLLPVAIAAWRRATDRPDPAQAAAVGLAAAAAVLVAAGLLLSIFDAVGAAGWLAAILAVDAVLLLGTRDRRALTRSAVPALLALAALTTAVGAIAFSHASARDADREVRFTQLWMLPRAGGEVAEIGVRNEEGAASTYRLTVAGPPSGGGAVLLDRTVRLGRSRSWVGSVALPPTARPERVTAELFRPGDAEPYRAAHVWTPAGP